MSTKLIISNYCDLTNEIKCILPIDFHFKIYCIQYCIIIMYKSKSKSYNAPLNYIEINSNLTTTIQLSASINEKVTF